jgi:hypothetical protein
LSAGLEKFANILKNAVSSPGGTSIIPHYLTIETNGQAFPLTKVR